MLMKLKWLIYCRVSSAKQVKEWNGLSSQEKRCRDYANNTLWIEVERVFNEEWVSWWVFERKSIISLFNYIDENKDSNYTIIFEDLNRLSRDVQVHSLLKSEFKKRWVVLASPNFQFEESPEWTFRENMSVSMAQYEKDKNKQRVNDRMRARLEQGYWCFKVPIGYKFTTNSKGWKEIILDESKYKIVKSALEKFANDELWTINDIARYLNKRWIKVWTIKNDKVYNTNLVSRILRNILYTWYLEFPKWNIQRVKAKHKAIISLNTYNKIQKKLNVPIGKVKQQIESNLNRVDLTEDFPLRWFLYCEESNQMISWAWSKWKREKFPYYTYPRKSSLHWKAINRDKFHKYFEEYLKSIQPNNDLINIFEKVVNEVIEYRDKENKEYKAVLEKEIKELDVKISNFIERIWNTSSEVLITNYEKQIENLNNAKQEILTNLEKRVIHVWTPFKRKITLMRDCLSLRKNGSLENKKALIKNIFPNWIPINEKKQVWTPTFSLIYQAFSLWKSSNCLMVEFIKKNLNNLLK